jgi:hypothetical protein
MNILRQKSTVLLFVFIVVLSVLVLQIGLSAPAQGAFKLEGAWVAKVTSFDGVPDEYPFQWSYILAPNASGKSAAIHASIDIGFPNSLLPSDFSSPIIGEMVQTGPNTASFNSYWYSIKDGPIRQIVSIGRSYGTATFLEQGVVEGEHNFQIFLPSADADGDGFPEGMPIKEFTVTTLDTRIPSPEW